MKKFIPLFVMMIATMLGAWAQNNPNRVIVAEKSGNYKGFLVERVDSMFFTKVEGRVAADVQVLGFKTGETGDTLKLSIEMTEQCWSYKIDIIPNNRMAMLSDEATLAAYIDQNSTTRYYNGFEEAEMTGMDPMPADADFTVATVGFDGYGIPCSTSTATFHTPKPEIVGNPYVEATVTDVTSNSFTISFSPNDDVSSYSCCSFIAGEAESQFNMFGAWMGFATIADMVYAWGIPQAIDYTHTWTQMNPGTDYEVLIAVKDKNGNFADIISVPVTTLSLGGEGLSEINIEIGEYIEDEDYGFLQKIIFTPNSETAKYHTLVITKEMFDAEWNDDSLNAYLMSPTDPYNPWNSYWDIFGVDDYLWSLDASTEYYAYALGQNAKGEWGNLAKIEFKTADSELVSSAAAPKMAKRRITTTTEGTARPKFPTDIKVNRAKSGISLK